MTSNYHTPIPSSPPQPANADTFNTRLADLDQAITDITTVEKDGHIIQDEGVDLPQQQRLNFVGNGVTASNGAGVTSVLIPGFNSWQSFVPSLEQGGAVTKTITYARYMQLGKLIIANVQLLVTGAGVAANAIKIGLPVTASTIGVYNVVGHGVYYDVSSGSVYSRAATLNGTAYASFFPDTAGTGYLGSSALTLANGDYVSYVISYEVP